ncbi:T9SS type A sorting domain-containing protein [Polluticoccus soli]|uniref:T9SS type A sorting domain-containing protein n=1 Tax=Polluticoccus soli TaxID=3034150 RepID=UPI0023E2C33F|nr:T9SS type A sorting domain-containing protein [Flavipsychrobacter sp. JY13-12]
MKALITLCFASLAATTALAQSQPTMVSQARYVISGGKPALQDSLTHAHSSGKVSYGLPEVKLSYSPNDGVYTAYESIRVYKSTSVNPPDLVDRMTRGFNSSGLLSEYHEFVKPATLYKEVYKESYQYNANDQLEIQTATNFLETRRLVYSYQNNIRVAKQYEIKNGTTWNVEGVDSFIAAGTDSLYLRYWKFSPPNMQVYEKHRYLRDANFRVTVDSFFDYGTFSQATFTTYDALGKKIQDSVIQASAPTYRLAYLYDNNGNLVTKTKGVWDNSSNAFIESLRDSFTYNVVDQLTSARNFKLDANNVWVPNEGSFWRYYYYGFPTGISEVEDNKGLRLYPVPATSYINIDMSFSKPEKFAVRILDMQGRIIRQWEETPQANFKKKIQLDGMPAGNYVVQVMSKNNNITRQFSVIN